ncbi:MAG: hypothetical protein AAF907_12355, partial [Planctomycetota bacterium]
MANETKVGLAVFAALVGVFGFVLYRKYDDRLTALAALHGAADDDAEQTAGDDPLAEGAQDGLGSVTETADTGDLPDLDEPFGGDAFGGDPTEPAQTVAATGADATNIDWGAEPTDPAAATGEIDWNEP